MQTRPTLSLKHAIYVEKEKTRLLLEQHLADEKSAQLRKYFKHFTSWSATRCGRFVVEVAKQLPAFIERVKEEQKDVGQYNHTYDAISLCYLKIHNAVRCKRPTKKVAIAVKAVTYIGELIQEQPYAGTCADILINAAQRSAQ